MVDGLRGCVLFRHLGTAALQRLAEGLVRAPSRAGLGTSSVRGVAVICHCVLISPQEATSRPADQQTITKSADNCIADAAWSVAALTQPSAKSVVKGNGIFFPWPVLWPFLLIHVRGPRTGQC